MRASKYALSFFPEKLISNSDDVRVWIIDQDQFERLKNFKTLFLFLSKICVKIFSAEFHIMMLQTHWK